MTTQIQLGAIESTAVSSLQGPRITAVTVTDNTYTAIDDTAVDSTSGGYIKITGTGFVTGCIVTVGAVAATSTTFISSTEVRAQLSAQAAGSYNLYVSNPDGSLSIKVLGINFSGIPSWTTAANQTFAAATVSFQFAANSDSTIAYSVNTGSTLPGGLSLSNNGLLSGNVSGTSGTVYTFTLQATDTENQNTPRTFVVTLSFSEPYFNLTTLLIHADGTNAANNNTFIDSSTNAFTITKAGTPIQGTFSPFSQTGWSNYLSSGNNFASTISGTGMSPYTNSTWTMEFWIYPTGAFSSYHYVVTKGTSGNRDWGVGLTSVTASTATIYYYWSPSSGDYSTTTSGGATITVNNWYHIAVVSTSGAVVTYVNGTSVGTGTQTQFNASNPLNLFFGSFMDYGNTFYPFVGHLSNFRYVQGIAVYTGAFTPPTSALATTQSSGTNIAAISNASSTKLLTAQSNRFVDKSPSAFTQTPTGTPSVQSFSPFGGISSYSTSLVGGSTYFNGSADYITAPSSAVLGLGTGDYTFECWIYRTSTTRAILIAIGNAGLSISINTSNQIEVVRSLTAIDFTFTGATVTNNTWQHIAVVRIGTNLNAYINGVSAGATQTSSTNYGSGGIAYIGIDANGSSTPFTGYISNLRLVKGTGVYTAAFTPPTAPVTAIANTSLLVDSTNASIYDQTSKNNLLTAGSTQISTAQYKFGTGSMYFNGSTDYITTAGTSQLLLFGTGAFTIEHWVKFTATTAYINSIGDNSHFTTTNNFLFMWNYAGAGRLSFWINNGVVCSTTNAYNNDVWHHVAVTRSVAGAITIWVDGVADGTGTNSAAIGTGSLIIGNQAQMTRYWAGYIDEVRVTRGYARYTTTFTAPTLAFNDQ